MATQASDTGSKGRMRGTASDELSVIAQRAQAFTNASGTAIALSEGSMDELICRARSGASSPEIGTVMRVEGSFTGLCVQSGKEVRCDDSETDTRVDTSGLRALGIRSMVITPIKDDNRVVGVLTVFAPTPHAFTITHVAVLKTMADQISMLLQKERRAREEGTLPEPATPRPAGPTAVAKPVAAPTPAPAPVVVRPTPAAPSRAAFPVVSKVEPIKTTVMAEEVAAPAHKREEKHTDRRSEARPMFGASETHAREPKKSGMNMMVVAGVAVLAIAAAGTFAFLKMRTPSSAPAPQTTQAAPNTSSAPSAQPAVAAVAPGNTQPAPPVAANTTSAPPPKPAVESSSSDRAARKPEKTQVRNVPAEEPEKRSTPETVAVATSSRFTPRNDSGPSADATPAVVVAAAPAPSALTALASSSAGSAAKPAMMTTSELEPIQVLRKVAPVYPLIAKQRHITGTVVVQGQVGKDGKITGLQFLSGPPVFRDAAFDAVKQWQFKPARLNGQPIEQTTKIQLSFGG